VSESPVESKLGRVIFFIVIVYILMEERIFPFKFIWILSLPEIIQE
jgi:hypothetical protein